MEPKKNNNDDKTNILHHVGLVNSNLDDSSAQYEKLGFTLTPLSLPKIILQPGGMPETLGAGNRHAIFEQNYLELLGIVDAQRWAGVTVAQRGPYNLDAPLSRYEGLHVMHLGTEHIEMVKARLDRQGTACSAIKVFERNVQTENGERTMKARSIYFPPANNPEGLLQIAQHDTPELIFQSRFMQHANGAKALTEILVIAENPAEYISKYEQYTGWQSKRIATDHFVVDMGLSVITIGTPGYLQAVIPGYTIPVLPFLAAFTIECTSLQQVRNVLSAGNIPFTEQRNSVCIYPEHACGCGIIFKER